VSDPAEVMYYWLLTTGIHHHPDPNQHSVSVTAFAFVFGCDCPEMQCSMTETVSTNKNMRYNGLAVNMKLSQNRQWTSTVQEGPSSLTTLAIVS